MLVLTRDEGTRIFIGDSITITILEAKRGRAVIGIEAPREIPIVRDDAVVTRQREWR